MHRSPERADHARCHAGLKAKRVPDRDDNLPNSQIFRIGQPHVSKMRRVDPNHRKVGIGIIAD